MFNVVESFFVFGGWAKVLHKFVIVNFKRLSKASAGIYILKTNEPVSLDRIQWVTIYVNQFRYKYKYIVVTLKRQSWSSFVILLTSLVYDTFLPLASILPKTPYRPHLPSIKILKTFISYMFDEKNGFNTIRKALATSFISPKCPWRPSRNPQIYTSSGVNSFHFLHSVKGIKSIQEHEQHHSYRLSFFIASVN